MAGIRPGTSGKKPSVSYSDFFKGNTTKPAVEPKPGSGGSSGNGTPIRRTGAINRTPGGFNAYPEKVSRSPGTTKPKIDPKAEALRRRLKKNARLKKSSAKVNAKLKS